MQLNVKSYVKLLLSHSGSNTSPWPLPGIVEIARRFHKSHETVTDTIPNSTVNNDIPEVYKILIAVHDCMCTLI